MNWNREYHYYLIFGNTTPDYIPWETCVWKSRIYPVLDKIFLKSNFYKQTGISSLQYVPKPNTTYYQQLKLGRLSWNPEQQEKWTLNPDTNGQQFHHLDIWTPARGVCARNDTSPDIFFSMSNEKSTYLLTNPRFDTFSIIAIARDLNYDPLPDVLQLSGSLKAKKTVYMTRGWQQQVEDENWRFINSIQDTMSANIYKGSTANLQKMDFEEIEFKPLWEIVYEG